MDNIHDRCHRSVELGFRPAEKRVHIIVPSDTVRDEVPIPGSGLRPFQRQSEPLLAGSECSVTFADSRQHFIEGVGQLANFVRTMFGSAHRIIVTFRDGGGDFGQFEDWQGDAPL